MTRFNKTKSVKSTTSYEGGKVYEKNPLEEWMNFLFSSYLEDGFYEKANPQTERFAKLTRNMIDKYGPEFVAKAAVFSRNDLGMRSVSQLVAAILNAEKFDSKRRFYRSFCHRPDDVAEIFAAVDAIAGKRSHALVRGCGDYISTLNNYSLGKYKMNNRTYNMFDVINITHANSSAIDAYKAGVLEAPDTWEVKISTAGSKEERDKEWTRLVEEGKLGYLALIRNIRNITESENVDRRWIGTYLVPALTDEKAIRKSLVFPYQIYSAYKNMETRNPLIVAALDTAFMIAIDNMPKLDGDSLILLDISGSMQSRISAKSDITICEAGAVYAACLAHQNEDTTIVKFGSSAKKYKFSKTDNVFNQIEGLIHNSGLGHGTNLKAAYQRVSRKYDRIFLISDMQIMADGYSSWWSIDESSGGIKNYEEYCRKYGPTPIYSFDLGNYSTQTSKPGNPNVYLCTALSEKVLKLINYLEDGNSLYEYINTHCTY